METVWHGIKLGIGLIVGFGVLFFLFREIRGFLYTLRFTRVGCTYQKGEKPGTPSGWLTRDPRIDDWLLWDVAHRVCLRMADHRGSMRWDDAHWQAWAVSRGVPADSALGRKVAEDSLQWNLSNYSLEQFLSLAREYEDHWKK